MTSRRSPGVLGEIEMIGVAGLRQLLTHEPRMAWIPAVRWSWSAWDTAARPCTHWPRTSVANRDCRR